MTDTERAVSRARDIAGRFSQVEPMRRGSMSERHMKCGKPGCTCRKDPAMRHGPYYSLTRGVGGKTRSRFLTATQAAIVKRQIEAGHRFREQVEAYWKACEVLADQEIASPEAASEEAAKKGASKRRSRRRSSGRSKP